MPPTINMVDPASGETFAVDPADVAARAQDGWGTESAAGAAGRLTSERLEDEYGGASGKVAAGLAAGLRGMSGGLSDFAIRGLGEEEDLRHLREVNPGISTVGEIAGAVGGAVLSGGGSLAAYTPAGAIARLGTRLGTAAEGAGVATRIGRTVVGAGVEGGLSNVGSTISDLALSEDPLTIERAASEVGSSFLSGVGIGGGTGLAFKGLEHGLRRAKGLLDKAATIGGRADDIAADLSALDRPALRVAREAEDAALEATRVGQRADLAGEIGAFRKDVGDQKLFLATKGIKEDGIGKLGKRTLNADREIDRLLDNPKMLAEKPHMAKAALQKQAAALEEILTKRETLVAKYAGDETATRMASLDAIPAALERNRGLQAKIAELVAKPASARLTAIQAADDALIGGTQKAGVGEQILQGAVFSAATGAASQIPGVDAIPGASAILGAFAARKASALLSGRLAKTAAAQAQRTSQAVDRLLDVTRKVAPIAPVIATKVLAAVAYAPQKPKKDKAAPKTTTLASLYRERADEIRSQVAPGPGGAPVMRHEARMQMSERLRPLAAMNPILADRMETLAARRLEFLASKLPKRPDLGGINTGPDRWQPSDMEMRTFARYAAGIEDPGGIEERVAAGTVTPEDAEVMAKVYPERKAEHVRQIIEKLGALREQLPYARRLALSIYSGVPVDAAMSPPILRVLQASFTEEPGTEGGTMAPKAAPQFGSVKVQDSTPSQQRQGAT